MQSTCDPCGHVPRRISDADRNGGKLYLMYLRDCSHTNGFWVFESTYTEYWWSAEFLIRNHPSVKRLRLLLHFSNCNLQHFLSHAFHPKTNLEYPHSITFYIHNWKYSFIIIAETIASSQTRAVAWRSFHGVDQPCYRSSLQSLDELSGAIISCKLPKT